MKAIVTKAFSGAEDGKFHPREIAVGEEIAGDLARVAVDGGLANAVKESELPLNEPKSPPKAKATKSATTSVDQSNPQ